MRKNRHEVICKECGLMVEVPFCRLSKTKYCSRRCSDKNTLIKKGQRISLATEFKKGHTFWLGKKRPELKGNPQSLEKYFFLPGDKHPGWIGDKVTYSGLHSWLRRNYTKPRICEFCHEEKNLFWANKSHKYKRDIKDWMALCRSCHSKYDREVGWGDARKRFGKVSYI